MKRFASLAALASLALIHTPVAAQDVSIALDANAQGPQINRHTFDAPDTISPRAIQGRVSNGRVTGSLPAKSVAVLALD